MNIILFDHPQVKKSLLPLTYTRPVARIRVGIMTIAEKWEKLIGASVSYLTEDYLADKFSPTFSPQNIYVNGAICPDELFISKLRQLKVGDVLKKDEMLLAYVCDEAVAADNVLTPCGSEVSYCSNVELIENPWDIFQKNSAQIRKDFSLITHGRKSERIEDQHTIKYGLENIFIEEGANIKAAVLNAEDGPIYIGKNAEVQEGALIKGPFALCESSVVNMGAKMRGDSTIGPFSKVGGEVSNSVIFGYSNKGHDGFMGNSVIGEWCNLGADTNTSNLKNNYANVKLWNYEKGGFKDTGLQFCGLVMGDHSKCGINTMFNTGTVVGVSSNIFGDGFPRNFIPSYSWGGASGFSSFGLKRAFEVADKVMGRRGIAFDEIEQKILTHICENTVEYRVWEK